MKPIINAKLVAPCGINCGICMAYLRDKNKCVGCRVFDVNKPVTRLNCKIKNCKNFKNGKKYCFECKDFPCKLLKHLDDRYKTKYDMSMIDNLEEIKKGGIKRFMKGQYRRYKCPGCGGWISVHNKKCYNCDKVYLTKSI